MLVSRSGLRLVVGLDSVTGARALAAAVGANTTGDAAIRVLVEIDTGGARTGVPPDAAGPLAAEAAALGLSVDGVFTHGGHGYASSDAREAAGEDEVRGLAEAAESLRRHGIESLVVSAGLDADRDDLGARRRDRGAAGDLCVRRSPTGHARSIGPDAIARRRRDDRRERVLGRGPVRHRCRNKSLGKDVAPYLDGHGEIPELGGAIVRRVFDYHGVVERIDGGPLPAVGDVVLVTPNHICPVVNLVDTFAVARDGRIVDRWRVDARGRNG